MERNQVGSKEERHHYLQYVTDKWALVSMGQRLAFICFEKPEGHFQRLSSGLFVIAIFSTRFAIPAVSCVTKNMLFKLRAFTFNDN